MSILFAMFVIIFVAQSFTEYKLVKNVPWFRENFYGWRASVISAGISTVMGFTAGTTIGKAYTLPFIMAGIVGAATNEMTYKFFEGYYATKDKVRDTKQRWSQFKEERPQFVKDVATGAKGIMALFIGFFAVIGKIIRAVGWVADHIAHAQHTLKRRHS